MKYNLIYPVLFVVAFSCIKAMARPYNTSSPKSEAALDHQSLFTQTKVIGNDDRRQLNPAELKIASGVGYFRIGNIPNDNEFIGTGAVVYDRRFVLTASHIFAKKGGEGWHNLILEDDKPMINDIYYYVEACRRSYPVAALVRGTFDFIPEQDEDVALVRLGRPVCKAATPLSMKEIDSEFIKDNLMPPEKVKPGAPAPTRKSLLMMLPGFNWVGQQVMRRVAYGYSLGEFYNRYNIIIKHNVDMDLGASGAPMIIKWNNEDVIVAINSGSINDPKEPNTAVAISSKILEWVKDSVDAGIIQKYPYKQTTYRSTR